MRTKTSAFESILDRAEEIAEEVAAPNAAEVDAEARWPEEAMTELQAELGGLVAPVEAGGLGRGLRALAEVCEILGRACSSTAICFGMHCVGTACIAARATPYQTSEWLRPIAAGEHLTTLSLSEPGTGSHFYFPQAELLEREDEFVVNGTKSFVTNGNYADSYVVSTAAITEGDGAGEFSLVVVPSNNEGVEWTDHWRGIGMRGNESRTMELRDVRLPEDHLLGAKGDQIWYVFQVVAPYFMVAMSGTYLGIAQAALEETRASLSGRTYNHGGPSPGETGVVQRELGSIWRNVESTRRLIYHAADAGDEEALLSICAAKADVARMVVEVVNQGMSLAGGRGYGENSTLGRLLRDARAAEVMAPTTQLLETWIGRSLLDEPLLGD